MFSKIVILQSDNQKSEILMMNRKMQKGNNLNDIIEVKDQYFEKLVDMINN